MSDLLFGKVEDALEEGGFDYCRYSGCFDIAARKTSMMLIKVLANIDSFQEEQANNLKVISKHLEATSLLVCLHTRRERLSDKILYERFEIPTMTPGAFETVIHNDTFPSIYRFRGGLFVEINPKSLRTARENAGLTQEQLAEKVGITKKSVYEHEKKKIKIEYDNAVRMEKALKTGLIEPGKQTSFENVWSSPKTKFETKVYKKFRSIGFDADAVYQSPFNMLAKDSKALLLSDVEEKAKNAKRKVESIKQFCDVSNKPAVIITKEEASFDLPTVTERDFLEMNQKDVRKIVRK
jgi:putative transcriptional regulator